MLHNFITKLSSMNTVKKKSYFRKKRALIPIILIVLLVILRIFLPSIVKNYANKALAEIPGYYGQVSDIDIAMFRGAYVINGLYINKVNAKTQVPFLNFPEADISIEWKSIFQGKIVSEVYLYNPEIIYVQEDMATADESTEEDWTEVLTDLIPIEINHFEVENGKLAFVEVNAEPTIDLHVNNLHFTANNLRNVVEKDRILPSPITGEGISIGNGKLSVKGNVNFLKEIPDMDISVSLEKVDLPALNDFTNYYGDIDFESGDFAAFTEIAIADGFLKGYFKILLKDSKFIGKEDGFLETLWEGFVSFFRFILKNQKTNTLAIKAPLEGDLSDIETSVWSGIGSIFRNAFIKAFTKGVDDEIEYEDAFTDKEKEEKKKKDKDKDK